jgi:hypothetical protein
MAFPPTTATIPTGGSLESRVRVLAEIVSKKADQTAIPMFSAVMLQAPGGAVWRVTVDDAGGLTTALVTR